MFCMSVSNVLCVSVLCASVFCMSVSNVLCVCIN